MSDTPGQRPSRFKSLEACRGIAAIMVAANHCGHTLGAPANFGSPPFGLLFQFGRSGADLFFVLSGFLIALIHWRDVGQPKRLPHYLARRLTRIFPTYWLVLLLVVPVDAATHTLFDGYDQPSKLIRNILLLPDKDRIIDVSWSLSNELLFYALMALAISNRIWGALALGVWIAALALNPIVAPSYDQPWIGLLTYPMNFEFIAGAFGGWYFLKRGIRHPAPVLCAGLAVFVCFAAAEDMQLLWSHENPIWHAGGERQIVLLRTLGYGTAYLLIIAGLSALEIRGAFRVPAWLVMLGGASYILYLIHIPALLILAAFERDAHLLRFIPGAVLASLFLAVIAATAIVFHLTVERRLLRAVRSP